MERSLFELDERFKSHTIFHSKFSELTASTNTFNTWGERELNEAEAQVESDTRPLTPINESIKCSNTSVKELCRILRKRIKFKSKPLDVLTPSQQQALLGVILSEFSSACSEVAHLPFDPFLSDDENREIIRYLAIELVTIAEELYFCTLDKAKELYDRGVFTSYANITRLKTQVALEANESLDSRRIQKSLTSCFKQSFSKGQTKLLSTVDSNHTSYSLPKRHVDTKQFRKKKHSILEKLVVLPRLTPEQKDRKKREVDMVQLQTQMPDISLVKVEEAFGISHRYNFARKGKVQDELEKTLADAESCDSSSEIFTGMMDRERRSQSLPNLFVGESILDELGIALDVESDLKRCDSIDKFEINLAVNGSSTRSSNARKTHHTESGQMLCLSEDLKKLVSSESFTHKNLTPEEYDLPPLFQAMSHHSVKRKHKKPLPTKNENEDRKIFCTVESSQASLQEHDVQSNFLQPTPPLQPDTVSTKLPNESIVRLSDVRVSNRVNKCDLTLNTYPTVYNDLIGEIDPAAVRWLDRNLYIGEEIREVYEEINKTVRKPHLRFDQDKLVESHATGMTFSSTSQSSALIAGSKDNHVINPLLYRDIPPPWGNLNVEEWKNSPMFGVLGRQDLLNMGCKPAPDFPSKTSKLFNSWLAWWRSTLTAEDYFKYITTQENDYLSLVYHLYDFDSDDAIDGDKDRTLNAKELEMKRLRDEKIAEMKKLKEKYEVGFWNANSVMLGGLGKYPYISDQELGFNVEVREDSLPMRVGDHSLTPSSCSSMHNKVENQLSLQDRLEKVWSSLCMPENLRLDMAIKYSSEKYCDLLEEVIQHWENAVKLILSREKLIAKLENFERLASDPNRFFERGKAGSPHLRMKEAKSRKYLHEKLDSIDLRIKRIIKTVYAFSGDVITFQGRSYSEKISNDRTEMLYWLQQERRHAALEIAKKSMELKILDGSTSRPPSTSVAESLY